MAQQALPPGAVRRRAAFGLFDADGWTWAGIKAFFWFTLIIFLQGYLPDRAYYFTVSHTLDLGFNVISPVNFCPAENKSLPCPAPAGALVPWDALGSAANLPAGRAGAGVFTSAEDIYLVGGASAGVATASVLVATTDENGDIAGWQEAPALPAARDQAAVVNLSGTPYVIGGYDENGAPTATVFQGTLTDGKLSAWEAVDELALPVPTAEAGAIATGTNVYVFGGRTADGLSATTYKSDLSTTGTPTLGPWQELTELPLPAPRASAAAVAVGNLVYVIGGQGPDAAATDSVYFLELDIHSQPMQAEDTGRPQGWGVSTGQAAAFALPAPRTAAVAFQNSGALYVIGGVDAHNQPATTNFWALPNVADGTIPAWQHLDDTDLPAPVADAPAAVIGTHVYVLGGDSVQGESAAVERAVVAPAPPFFRLGLFGLTIPALSIGGEIGQQLGYIAAGTVVAATFVLLVIIGWLYSHPGHARRFFVWVSRGRIRGPIEEEA
jgi:N-acetylneuraminic acid mutarotase